MIWKKLGRIIKPQTNLPWMKTHAMLPTPIVGPDGVLRVYFSGRDDKNRSMIGFAIVDPEKGETQSFSPSAVLEPGRLGCFDDNGVTPASLVQVGDETRLYFIGWRPRSTTRMSLMPGLAASSDGGNSFRRVTQAPVLRLTDQEPIFILTSPCVIEDQGKFKMWYVSGTEWVHPDLPKYNIKYAESSDGINWDQTGLVCIDHDSEEETSLARPWVIKEDGIFKMWYSSKRPPETYRIGYAESKDGKTWTRKDQEAGITVSQEGWDSEMIEYGAVFKFKGNTYMLYNGNGYGENGAGLAVLER